MAAVHSKLVRDGLIASRSGSLHNGKLIDEHASADHEAAETFPAQLVQLIKEKGYGPQQVFNVHETSLFWKKMPMRTFISK